MSERVGSERGEESVTPVRLPLNSKRLTVSHLRRLASEVGVPTDASADELRQMIDGKLTEDGRDALNIQVVLLSVDPSSEFSLEDEGGKFLTVPAAVWEAEEDNEQRESEDEQPTDDSALRQELETLQGENQALQDRVACLEQSLQDEKTRFRELWRTNCRCLVEYDSILVTKDGEIEELKRQLRAQSGHTEAHPATVSPFVAIVSSPGGVGRQREEHRPVSVSRARKGKAPPVDPFTGEDLEVRLDDWLPSLERARVWNDWTEDELMMQLAGHLRGRALQEWSLLDREVRRSYTPAIEALRLRLDPGSRTLAAQEFRHTSQGDEEKVADFIRRPEWTFNVAYGREGMSAETRDTLLHGQLQDGLRHEIMQAPAVSGAQTYPELCLAVRNEEKRLAELKKRQQYLKQSLQPSSSRKFAEAKSASKPMGAVQKRGGNSGVPGTESRKCFLCHRPGHIARDCKEQLVTRGRGDSLKSRGRAKQVTTPNADEKDVRFETIQELCYSSDEDGTHEVRGVRVTDQGSKPQCVRILIQGVPAYGIIDSGADITIMGGILFKKVAAVAKFRRRDLKRPDKSPRNYDHTPFTVDGRIDMDVTFDGKTMRTPVYIKANAHDQLLLSEGVCRQLGILWYHSEVEPWRGGRKQKCVRTSSGTQGETTGLALEAALARPRESVQQSGVPVADVPTIRVRMVESVRLLPHQGASVTVQVEGSGVLGKSGVVLLEPSPPDPLLHIPDSVLRTEGRCLSRVQVFNPTGCSCRVEAGTDLGEAVSAELVEAEGSLVTESDVQHGTQPVVRHVTAAEVEERKRKLCKMVGKPELLTGEQTEKLHQFLAEHHEVFSLDPNERGETDWHTMQIDTGEAAPRKQLVRRMPFAVRAEVAKQLREMQAAGVVQPSSSPWASPVVMVRKRDGTLRFCVDYRELNSVTKADTFPLPRIDDLLDQLGAASYFSTLDLASGYWQVPMHPDSIEKTAFVTPQGLYEFRVMPFGLTNAPGVFQRLMEKVLAGLNPDDGPDYVAIYIDDVLVFSRTLEEHLQHLRKVIQRLCDAGLKLKPSKCRFIREEVEYLGHVITPQGLKTNPRIVSAITEFPRPRNLGELRRFLGLSSYYRRFVHNFAKIASPLHGLTRKNVRFNWTADEEHSFQTLKEKLISTPVLAYPSFEKSFVLETDASIEGIGAILSQPQEDDLLHPVAYASRSLTVAERNYAITELETLAVVWAITHFIPYLYGHDVTVLTDHTAVKAILQAPNPSGKHARWWTKVYGSGVKSIKIQYRPGRLNSGADALSRSPQCSPSVDRTNQGRMQVATVTTATVSTSPTIQTLLTAEPTDDIPDSFADEQQKDPALLEIFNYLLEEELPAEDKRARKIALQSSLFVIEDGLLYFVDPKQKQRRRAAVPRQLQEQILIESHSGTMCGHFSGRRTYATLARQWWWEGMLTDVLQFAKNCPVCATVSGGGKVSRPPLHPIPVQRLFQIVGVDVMDLPTTADGNCHVVVFQDYLTKWPLVYPVPDQKSIRLVRLLVEEVIPFFGVPEALLSDRGTNLLSSLMKDICQMMGIKKLNTTSYHPQCDGMVERFNRTLKAMLRKQAAICGSQWDRYLHAVLWAYRNTPHETTGEKPSFLLFGYDCRTPSEAALLPPSSLEPATITYYREHVMLSLSSARELAVQAIKKAQGRYKTVYDRKSVLSQLKVGDWVLVKFPQDETGRLRKLSRPWHGPYRIVSREDPDVSVIKVYYPLEKPIRVHLSRVAPCPSEFTPGYYWYGTRRCSSGRPPKWVQKLLAEGPDQCDVALDVSQRQDSSEDVTASSLEDTGPPAEVLNGHGHDGEMDSSTIDVPEPTVGQQRRYNLRTRTTAPAKGML